MTVLSELTNATINSILRTKETKDETTMVFFNMANICRYTKVNLLSPLFVKIKFVPSGLAVQLKISSLNSFYELFD